MAMEKVVFGVLNLACGGCARRLERVLRKEGISDVSVDLSSKTVEVHFHPEKIGREEIRALIESSGFVVA